MAANALRVIFPYKDHGVWVFDDASVGLVKEPFVCGAPEIIERLVKDIPKADRGFTLLASAGPFPRYQAELVWLREESGGHWYRLSGTGMEAWLCPALLLYFSPAPARLYVATEPRSPKAGGRR
ncbi:MAG: DUF6717 family protein [Bryobacteraceae bacterium]